MIRVYSGCKRYFSSSFGSEVSSLALNIKDPLDWQTLEKYLFWAMGGYGTNSSEHWNGLVVLANRQNLSLTVGQKLPPPVESS